ncbi:Amino acid transporter [Giardia duodenalis assemblage B]|uniref:Amino acid transporter n=1 Tax=Giardia duodenalis assemblage B TaxID=1394984 RepID=A0A132NMH0_GIAIN|nr:Amino acid transporter [Giardia intestinalis assemblage B]
MAALHMLDTHTRPIIAAVLGHTKEGTPSGIP